jgi:hypothetical protein
MGECDGKVGSGSEPPDAEAVPSRPRPTIAHRIHQPRRKLLIEWGFERRWSALVRLDMVASSDLSRRSGRSTVGGWWSHRLCTRLDSRSCPRVARAAPRWLDVAEGKAWRGQVRRFGDFGRRGAGGCGIPRHGLHLVDDRGIPLILNPSLADGDSGPPRRRESSPASLLRARRLRRLGSFGGDCRGG